MRLETTFGPDELNEHHREPLDFVKILFRSDGRSLPLAGIKIHDFPSGTFVVQVPCPDVNLVIHLEVMPSGKVLAQYRKIVFDGFWSNITRLDLAEDYQLNQLAE